MSKVVKTHTRSKDTSCDVNNSLIFVICITQTKLTSITIIVMMKSTIININ